MTTCLCGMPNGTLHSHFCPVGRVVPRLEYAPEGTSRKLREAEAAIARVRDLCQESGPGWIEWLMPGVATTHIAHVSEDGYIYLPGGEGTDDFLLASARGRSWRLLSVVDIARAIDGGAE